MLSFVIPNSVISIGGSAFQNCSNLISVTIPNSVASIGNYTFSGCNGLDSVTIPNSVTSIGHYAFQNCSSLISVMLPDSITEIKTNTFAYCSSLVSITIPDNITNIMSNAFNGCSSLQKVYIGCNVTTWDRTAFAGCVSLDTLYYNARNIPNYTVFNPPLGLDSVRMAIFGDSVYRIPAYLFLNYPSLSPNSLNTVIIGKNVAYIETGAFSCCNDITSVWMMSPIPPSNPSGFHNAQTVHILCGALQAYQNEWGGNNYQEHLCNLAVFPYDLHGTAGVATALSWDSNIVISAQSHYGYHFDHWSNGDSSFYSIANPDTIHFYDGDTIKAFFERNTYNITVTTTDSAMGNVAGSNYALFGDYITISASPNYGYHFVKWSDNNTQNPRMVYVQKDTTYSAIFDYNSYFVDLYTNDFEQGDLPLIIDNSLHDTNSGSGVYNYLSDLSFLAIPKYGYHFTMWNDGDTNNPRNVTLTQDTSMTSLFSKNQYYLTAVPNDTSLGLVTGGGIYDYLDVVTLTAVCTAEHYHFEGWRDTSSSDDWLIQVNPINLTIYENKYYEAVFELDYNCASFNSEIIGSANTIGGSVHYWSDNDDSNEGITTYGCCFRYGSNITIEAIADEGYHFCEWGNGSRNTIESFTLTNDTTIIVIFASDAAPEICMVSVQDNRNVLMWTKDNRRLAYYNIYREGITFGDYELITNVPYDSMSIWIDEDSRPANRSYRYKISATDIYEIETEESDIHKTMHLTISQGIGNSWNLVWTEYEGADYSSYQIYRGTSYDNVELIDQMPAGGNTTYTDYDVDQTTVYYQVAIVKDEPCYTAKSSSIIRSNVATNGTIGIQTVVANDVSVEVYPNPAQDKVTVTSDNNVEKVEIMDISGRTVQTFYGGSNVLQIPLTDISSGTYMLQVITSEGVSVKKLIVK